MPPSYEKKARLVTDISDIEQYRPILEKDNFQKSEPHWRKISKNTITLFQVLIDQDLRDLVNILRSYPQYVEWVCEHFRYAYSYSENYADVNAASTLLTFGEPYYSKQFVRNVIRKLPKVDDMTLDELIGFSTIVASEHKEWHPIVTNYYVNAIMLTSEKLNLHPLQKVILTKSRCEIPKKKTYEYGADDRDAVLDIPYMN
jgi:hypothetical protein